MSARDCMDLSAYASHELRLNEVQDLARNTPKFWGFMDGMFIAGNDDMIALRFYRGHNYEAVTREIWRRCCKTAKAAVDVGTHSGVFTLDAHRAGAKAVISVEPHPINYSRLVMNLRYNGFPCDGVFYGAAGEQNKIGSFHVANLRYVHAAGQMDEKKGHTEQVPVRVVRLDRLIKPEMWPDLAVLKIDAENYTRNVIDGMSEIFKAGHRPDMIVECIEGGLGEKLKALGYKFWRIWETGRVEIVDDLIPHNPDNNYNGTDEDCRNRFCSVNGLPETSDG